MKRIKRKLRARAGETLTETLAALLVGVIALAILAGMVMSSSKLVVRSRTRVESYYSADAKLNRMLATDGGTTAAVTIKDSESGDTRRLTDAQLANEISVWLFENGKASSYSIK